MNSHRISLLFVVVSVVLVGVARPAHAQQPLYDPVTGASLFTSLKAYDVGDVITIVIRETAVASSNAKTESSDKTEIGGGPGTGALGFMQLWGLDSENKYSGDGKTERSGSLFAEMSAQLVERLPNGQFRIEGKRTIRINGEFETIIVSGLIRVRDVNSDNKITSTSIADATIVYEGEGDVGRASSPGILTKIVSWIF